MPRSARNAVTADCVRERAIFFRNLQQRHGAPPSSTLFVRLRLARSPRTGTPGSPRAAPRRRASRPRCTAHAGATGMHAPRARDPTSRRPTVRVAGMSCALSTIGIHSRCSCVRTPSRPFNISNPSMVSRRDSPARPTGSCSKPSAYARRRPPHRRLTISTCSSVSADGFAARATDRGAAVVDLENVARRGAVLCERSSP